MTIHDRDAYIQGVWDWAILRGCFGNTKIEPTDIDGFVERKGNFLVLEAKAPGVQVPLGQMITYKALTKDKHFTVMIIWGKTNEPCRILVMYGGKEQVYENATLETLRERVNSWFVWADRASVVKATE